MCRRADTREMINEGGAEPSTRNDVVLRDPFIRVSVLWMCEARGTRDGAAHTTIAHAAAAAAGFRPDADDGARAVSPHGQSDRARAPASWSNQPKRSQCTHTLSL